MDDERFNYWKKVYFLLGEEFYHRDWADIENDGYDLDIHGHPYDDSMPYIHRVGTFKINFQYKNV